MDDITIRYWSPHGRQEETKFQSEDRMIELTTRAAKMVDLSNLSKCTKLETLNLANNMLEELDLSPLSNNQKLTEIRLENNHLSNLDLWPLGNCHSITRLNIVQNRLQSLDVTPILSGSQVLLDSSVVLYADFILRYILTSKELVESFLLFRPDRAPWTAPPVLMWVAYENLAMRMEWSAIRERIFQVLDQLPDSYWYQIQRGLLIGLGMQELAGFDGDPSKILDKTTDSMDYKAARRAIFDRTVELLYEQISRGGPTLFLDIEAMEETRASKLIGKIIEARKLEIEKVVVPTKGSISLMNSLWLSHYGYNILQALGVGMKHIGADIEQVKKSFTDLGFSLRTRNVESLQDVEVPEPVITSQSMKNYVFNEIEKAYQ
ncbi:MAG: hypothetical protein ACFFCX_12605 [Candidatus Sifarchaeia archaeon]